MTNETSLPTVATSVPASVSAVGTATNTEVAVDGLGRIGPLMTAYHVGDLMGVIGLLLTWLTYRQAKAARAAAREAAASAIRSRDRLEMATRLSELSARLRTIRDIYLTDSWGVLDISKDHAVAIAVEVKAIEAGNSELVDLMKKVEDLLREEPPRLEHVKDDDRRHQMRRKLVQRTNVVADGVDEIRLRKVKHGT